MDMQKRKKLAKKLEKEPMTKKQIMKKYKLNRVESRIILDSFGSELRYKGRFYYIDRSVLPTITSVKPITLERDEKIGLFGDTHLCSKYTCVDSIHEYYDDCDEAGIKKMFHSGDLTDGYLVYRGQLEELLVWGEPNQREYVVKNYPRKKGMKTRIIAGNHDLEGFRKGGSNIVENICNKRPDMEYDGMYFNRYIVNEKIKFDILHDTSRRAYALSYPGQRRQRDTPPSQRPHISGAGHRHIMFYAYYNDEHMFETGCFMKSNPYLLGRGIQSTIAAWILELKIKDDLIEKIKPEMLVYT